jgi:hypothetical protein
MLKKIILTIVITVFILKLVELGAEWSIARFPETKTNYISQKKFDGIKILYHGACEVEWVVNPGYLDSVIGLKSYNLATGNSNFADNYLDLHIYLKKQQKPDYVILQVSPESFEARNNNLKVFNFANFFDDTTVVNVLNEGDKRYMSTTFIPFLKFSFYSNFTLFRVFAGFLYGIANVQDPRFVNGYRSPDGFDQFLFGSLLEKKNNYKWSSYEEKYLIKIIELCKTQNIKLVFFRVPTYLPYQRINPILAEKNKLIEQIASDHNVPYFSYDNLEMNNDSSNFFNIHNMSTKGSEKFLKIFANQLKDSIFK